MAKQVKKGAKGTNRIDTLLAAIAEWIGVPKRSNIGKLINPPPPANVPIVVAKTPVKKINIYSILHHPFHFHYRMVVIINKIYNNFIFQ